MGDQNKEGTDAGAKPKIEGPDAERWAGNDQTTAARLPGHTPQARSGDSPDDPSGKPPGFTPQGRTNP